MNLYYNCDCMDDYGKLLAFGNVYKVEKSLFCSLFEKILTAILGLSVQLVASKKKYWFYST